MAHGRNRLRTPYLCSAMLILQYIWLLCLQLQMALSNPCYADKIDKVGHTYLSDPKYKLQSVMLYLLYPMPIIKIGFNAKKPFCLFLSALIFLLMS